MPFYIAAQVLGSIAASFALKGIFHPYMHGGVTLPQGDEWPSFVLEFIISFNLMFVITAVATDTRAVSLPNGVQNLCTGFEMPRRVDFEGNFWGNVSD